MDNNSTMIDIEYEFKKRVGRMRYLMHPKDIFEAGFIAGMAYEKKQDVEGREKLKPDEDEVSDNIC